MKRKTSTAPTRIWTYGCKNVVHGSKGPGPTDGADLVEAQMSLAHKYQNKLIEIERRRRDRYRKILGKQTEVARLEAELLGLNKQIEEELAGLKRARAAVRKRVQDPEVTARVKALKDARRSLYVDFKAAKAAAREASLPEIQASDAEAQAEVKAARATCGVHWGTYLLIEQAMDQTRKSKEDPRFRRFDGRGRLGVQLQGGLSVADAYACKDTRLQIEAPVPKTEGSPRMQRRRLLGKVRIRIGSDGRNPVWATFPVVLHRPLPADGTIKWAWFRRQRVGTAYRWEFQVMVEAPSFERSESVGNGAVAIDIGWRARPDAIRVGYFVGTDGAHGEITMPASISEAFAHVESLRSIRDRIFNETKARLVAWLDENQAAATPVALPEWLVEGFKFLPQWKSTSRLSAIAWRWVTDRFPGDEAIFDVVDAWRKQDRHLLQWEANRRDRIFAHRRDLYRNIAARFVRKYARIVFGDYDLRVHAERAKPLEIDNQPAAGRHNRFAASPSEFRLALKNAALLTGCAIEVVDAAWTTVTCHVCKHIDKRDVAERLTHLCSSCGALWDQDYNAAVNLLKVHASGGALRGPGEPLDGESTEDPDDSRGAEGVEAG